MIFFFFFKAPNNNFATSNASFFIRHDQFNDLITQNAGYVVAENNNSRPHVHP